MKYSWTPFLWGAILQFKQIKLFQQGRQLQHTLFIYYSKSKITMANEKWPPSEALLNVQHNNWIWAYEALMKYWND